VEEVNFKPGVTERICKQKDGEVVKYTVSIICGPPTIEGRITQGTPSVRLVCALATQKRKVVESTHSVEMFLAADVTGENILGQKVIVKSH